MKRRDYDLKGSETLHFMICSGSWKMGGCNGDDDDLQCWPVVHS